MVGEKPKRYNFDDIMAAIKHLELVHNTNTDALIKGMDALSARIDALNARIVRLELHLPW